MVRLEDNLHIIYKLAKLEFILNHLQTVQHTLFCKALSLTHFFYGGCDQTDTHLLHTHTKDSLAQVHAQTNPLQWINVTLMDYVPIQKLIAAISISINFSM